VNGSEQHIETVRKFALEGPLSQTQLSIIGVAVLLLIVFLAWRDYKAAGSRALFFFLLVPRLAALVVALWMLAGPSVVTVSRQFKPKSVVVLADGSGSMGLVDAVDGSGNTLRWSAAQSMPAMAALDKVFGSLCSAQSAVNRIRDSNKTADESQQSKELWDQIRESMTSAADDLGGLSSDAGSADAQTRQDLSSLGSFLKDSFSHISSSLVKGHVTHHDQQNALDDLDAFLTAARRRVERLGNKLAAQCEAAPSSREQAALAGESRLTRKEKVTAWLMASEDSWLKDLESKARVLRYKFAANVLPVADKNWRTALAADTNLDNRGTDLGAALNQAVRDASQQSVDAVVLLTDGGHNTPDDPRDAAAALRGVPLFIVPIGSTVIPRDVILHHIQCPRAVFKNDNVVLDAMLTAYHCEGETVRVELWSDGNLVDNQSVTINASIFDGRVAFHWKGTDLGRHILKVRAQPLPKEHSVDNNEAQTEVEVMENTIRVLLADDLPRWEFRYLSMLFKRDKHVEFDQLIFEPNDDSQGTQQSFPVDLEGWRKYRVVILGDVTPDQLTAGQQEMLRKYVTEDGGNLVIIAGETAMPAAYAGQPLGDMIPATSAPIDPSQGYNLTVTAEGGVSVPTQLDDDPLASDRIWREMSGRLPIYNLSPVSHPKSTGHVLISATTEQGGDARAFLSWQYVGLGRVIYISAPITYQLRYGIGDLYHHRFWGQLLRWAVAREMAGGSKTVHLLTDKNRYEVGDHSQVVLRLTGLDGAPVPGAQCGVEAIRDNQVIKVIELHEEAGVPGAYRGIYSGLSAGPITLRATGGTVNTLLASEGHSDPVEQILNVDFKGTSELSDPVCNLPLLNQLADASGGVILPPAAMQNALAHLNVAPDAEDSELARTPVWDQWIFLWIIIGCLTIEWLARRHWRML
jgi:hypothetical protein